MTRVICFGPGPKFKGGLSNYNTSLAKAFDARPDTEVKIISWTSQYPAIIPREFVDKTSKKDFLEGTTVELEYITNYNNPSTWKETYRRMLDYKPDMIIFQWSIALQGIPLGSIAKKLSKHKDIEVLFDLHFVIQKEGSRLDDRFTKLGLKYADTFITHAYKTVDELKELFPQSGFEVNESGERSKNATTVIKLFHPIYDLFEPDPSFDVASFKSENDLKKHVFLFFGFIRKYKGLHHAIRAFNKVAEQRDDVSLMICGESFWKTLPKQNIGTKVKTALFGLAKKIFLKKKEDEGDYNPLALIEELALENHTMLVNSFIPNEDVQKYFQASDAVLLFYEYATPSGIESLSYNFKKPLIATAVGHFPETIEDGVNGYLAKAEDIEDMAAQMLRFIDQPIDPENVAKKTEKMSWARYTEALLNR